MSDIWGSTNVLWSEDAKTWSEGDIVSDCIKWMNASQLWQYSNWMWNGCSGSYVPPIPPVPIATFGQDGVDATTLIPPWLIEPWNPFRAGEKKKKLVRLICKVKGVEYDESKSSKDFNITVDDIKLVIDQAPNIGIKIGE